MSIEQARQAAVDAVKQLNQDVGIPANLKAIGVKLEDIPALAKAAFDDVCTGGNPRDTNVSEIEQLYHAIYE
jgi:Alcohol dehydrogenase, class IV